MEISAILWHRRKPKINRLHCDLRVKQFAHKKRSVRNSESVKTQIVACVFSLIVRTKITFQNSNFSILRFLPFDKICDFQMKVYFKRHYIVPLKNTASLPFGKHRLFNAFFHFIAKMRKFANPRLLRKGLRLANFSERFYNCSAIL